MDFGWFLGDGDLILLWVIAADFDFAAFWYLNLAGLLSKTPIAQGLEHRFAATAVGHTARRAVQFLNLGRAQNCGVPRLSPYPDGFGSDSVEAIVADCDGRLHKCRLVRFWCGPLWATG